MVTRWSRNLSMTQSETQKAPPCWCDHLEGWHTFAGVCRWCAKMELRRPQFNFMPRHALATEIPEELRRQAAEAVDRHSEGSTTTLLVLLKQLTQRLSWWHSPPRGALGAGCARLARPKVDHLPVAVAGSSMMLSRRFLW